MARQVGQATPKGTGAFRDRALARGDVAPRHFREDPNGRWLSSIGMGTYLGAPDPLTDLAIEEAVSVSVRSGRVNVIDTALNYRHQRAERSVGRALARLFAGAGPAREEIFVATKIGYIAPDGESGKAPAQWVQDELIRPGALSVSDIVDGSHAMSPSFLKDQLARSQTNLGLETIDLVYLHNAPDAQLGFVGAAEFKRRLTEAFRTLEELRSLGTLGAYGLATWDSLRSGPGAPLHLSLEAAADIAGEVGGPSNGFRFIQFPLNPAMAEAWAQRTQVVGGQPKTVLEAAGALGIGCFTSVPLLQGQLARRGQAAPGWSRAQTALQWARSAPGNLAALVGQKRPEHVAENLRVASRDPWDAAEFSRMGGAGPGPSGPR